MTVGSDGGPYQPVAGGPWSGVPDRDVLDVVATAGAVRPPAPAIIFEDGVTVSCGELLDRAEHLAGFLSGRIQAGDMVAVMLENRAEFFLAWLAIAANRATTVSINPRAGVRDCGHVLRDSGSVLAITSEDCRSVMENARSDGPALREVLYADEPEPRGLETLYKGAKPVSFSRRPALANDIINVYYTSGTTGLPKGCMLDHWWWLRMADLFHRLYGMSASDRLLCSLPLFYGDPPWMLVASLRAGTPLIVMRRFSVSRFWDVVDHNHATLVYSIGAIPTLLLKQEPTARDKQHPMRLAVHLGIPKGLHRDLIDRWGFPWVEAYGLTEAGLVTAVPLEEAKSAVGSGTIGRACPEAAVRVVDEDGRTVPPGVLGEFVVRAPGMMRGYLGRADATAEVFRDGWFHTGDTGYADEHGRHYFVGRQKDIIRRSGENVAAAEVEAVLKEHPQVLDAAVIPVPDAIRGEEVLAFIIPSPASLAAGTNLAAIVEFCAQRLARHKVPRYLMLRSEEFPRTPSMRVRKNELVHGIEELSETWDRSAVLGW